MGGACLNYEVPSGGAYGDLGSLDNRASAFDVWQSKGLWNSITASSKYPNNSENNPHVSNDNFWADEAQGVAHDETHWYLTNKEKLFKVPVSESLNNSSNRIAANLPGGCDHFGDPAFYGDLLYVPLEGCPNGESRIYVYNRDLQVLRYGRLPGAKAAWVAVSPINGLMYSTVASYTDKIQAYKKNFTSGQSLQPLYEVSLPDNRYAL
jgi:hypothetical protein